MLRFFKFPHLYIGRLVVEALEADMNIAFIAQAWQWSRNLLFSCGKDKISLLTGCFVIGLEQTIIILWDSVGKSFNPMLKYSHQSFRNPNSKPPKKEKKNDSTYQQFSVQLILGALLFCWAQYIQLKLLAIIKKNWLWVPTNPENYCSFGHFLIVYTIPIHNRQFLLAANISNISRRKMREYI